MRTRLLLPMTYGSKEAVLEHSCLDSLTLWNRCLPTYRIRDPRWQLRWSYCWWQDHNTKIYWCNYFRTLLRIIVGNACSDLLYHSSREHDALHTPTIKFTIQGVCIPWHFSRVTLSSIPIYHFFGSWLYVRGLGAYLVSCSFFLLFSVWK